MSEKIEMVDVRKNGDDNEQIQNNLVKKGDHVVDMSVNEDDIQQNQNPVSLKNRHEKTQVCVGF